MKTSSSITALLATLSVSPWAAAQATSTLDSIEIYPSMHTASVYAATACCPRPALEQATPR